MNELTSSLTLSYDPNFLIIDSDKQDEFIFYNTQTHFGCRCNALEMKLMDLVYKYGNVDYIADSVNVKYREQVRKNCQRIIDEGVLCNQEFIPEDLSNNKLPSLFYLHLTYRCNLSCTYCYNKKIRTDFSEMKLQNWLEVANRILPYADKITLTGGEPFLYPELLKLVSYLKEQKPNIEINCISNGMHDFSKNGIQEILQHIKSITFSCDSINTQGDRTGFDPQLFKKNIIHLKENNKGLGINISTTLSQTSKKEAEDTEKFSWENHCGMRKITLIPYDLSQISNMIPIQEVKEALSKNKSKTIRLPLDRRALRCGAGYNVCSIDPSGNVYPCQSLHYNAFLMGNILTQQLPEMRFIKPESDKLEALKPIVNNLPGCKLCKVKYICAGGCLAPVYALHGAISDRNQLVCPYNYETALSKLRNIP